MKNKIILVISLCPMLVSLSACFDSNKNLDKNNYEDDQAALMKRYESKKDSYTIDQFLEHFETYELVNIGFNKIKEHDYHYQIGIGTVNAMGVKQQIRSFSIKDKEQYFAENLSKSSLVKVAKRFYQEGDNVTTYTGDLKTVDTAVWNEDKKENNTVAEYKEKWGKDLSESLIYTISSKTTLETSTKSLSRREIKVSLDLDPRKSTQKYVVQMATTSDLTDYPIFTSVHIDYYLDEQLNLLRSSVSESYRVKKGVWASAKATLDEYHCYDEKLDIPTLDTNCDYDLVDEIE